MSSYQVRDAEERDLEKLLGLYGELAEGDFSRMPADVEVSRVVLARIISDQRRHLCVAENGNEVVGSAELIVIEGLTHGAMRWAVIENVIVSGEIRGSGAGTALLEHLLNLARASGCYKVQLHSGKQRADAHRLYRRLGFRPVAEGFKLYFDDTRSNLDNEVPERP
jgi:ribosomal protein S18 acetylase RimI-like enzyme